MCPKQFKTPPLVIDDLNLLLGMFGKRFGRHILFVFLLTLVLKQTISGTCSFCKPCRWKREPELKLTFNYANKIYNLFYIRHGIRLPSMIQHCVSNQMEIAFINSKKMVGNISVILKNNQIICQIGIGGYVPKQRRRCKTKACIDWQSIVKNRNPKVQPDCLMLSDRDWYRKGGPVYRLFAGAKQCQYKISQFLCERDQARDNTKASTTTSLFTSEPSAPLDQNYTAMSLRQNYRTISLRQNYTAISVWPSLTDVKSTMVKGKVMAS